ncbi:MAG: pantetheine-phosphate adenylyltransferase [Paludibacteraceae bacterium]|nr:pantetheine-phosphate adenylyltransferase [Paludibacteraceae bacterium]
MRTAIFPGSFDPFTIGHLDIVERGLQLFDRVVIGIGRNSMKGETFPLAFRVESLKDYFKSEERVAVDVYDGLTVDFARMHGAKFLLRGVRTVQDFEYEQAMAEANRQLDGIETVLLYARPEHAYISSSLVRELYSYNRDVSRLVPCRLP